MPSPLFSLFSAATYQRVLDLRSRNTGFPPRACDPTAPTHRQTAEPDLPKPDPPPVPPVLSGVDQAPIHRRRRKTHVPGHVINNIATRVVKSGHIRYQTKKQHVIIAYIAILSINLSLKR